MDDRSGRIYSEAEMQAMTDVLMASHLKVMRLAPTVAQMVRQPPRVAAYDPCPCGSGKKFKFCCKVKP
jgi:uncharacterized protein YecA (UPF0149 family)